MNTSNLPEKMIECSLKLYGFVQARNAFGKGVRVIRYDDDEYLDMNTLTDAYRLLHKGSEAIQQLPDDALTCKDFCNDLGKLLLPNCAHSICDKLDPKDARDKLLHMLQSLVDETECLRAQIQGQE